MMKKIMLYSGMILLLTAVLNNWLLPQGANTTRVYASPSPGTAQAYRVVSNVTMDGLLQESFWKLPYSVTKTISGTPNNICKFDVVWDNTNLYIAIDAKDVALPPPAPPPMPHFDDSIEIYIDGNHDHGPFSPQYDRYFMKYPKELDVIHEKNGQKTGVLCKNYSGKYEWRIPWSNLGITPYPGLTLGLDIGNKDDDNGGGYDNWLMWQGTAANETTGQDYGDLVLSEGNCVDKGFLIITSNPLVQTGQLTQALYDYQSDLTAAGWYNTLIRVNNVADGSAEYICPDGPALKNIIAGFYGRGYQGFVLIGSAPAIPTVWWEEYNDGHGQLAPCDGYYADMDGVWSDVDADGRFESYVGSQYVGQNYGPEMFWGRISAGSISASLLEEASKTAAYLNKVHQFRWYGDNLPTEAQNRALVYADDDWSVYYDTVENLWGHVKEVRHIYEPALTTPEKLKEELEFGAQFAVLSIHADWSIKSWLDSYDDLWRTDFDRLKLSQIAPKAHYVDLSTCGGCDYSRSNLGAIFLFNNNYTYNVTGPLCSLGFWPSMNFYAHMNATSIGQGFKDEINLLQQSEPARFEWTLLGDPTLRYNKPVNKYCPRIINQFKFTEAVLGETFTLPLEIGDPESTSAIVEVTGLPGLNYQQSVPLSSRPGLSLLRGNCTLTWTPTAADAGKTYLVTAKATDPNGKSYVTQFPVYVSFFKNGSLITDPGAPGNGWTLIQGNTTPPVAPYPPRNIPSYGLAATNNTSAIRQVVSVSPGMYYTLSCWVKNNLVPNQGLIRIEELNTDFPVSATGGNWILQSFRFNSGNHNTLTITLRAGTTIKPCTGNIFFTELQMIPYQPAAFLGDNFSFEQKTGDYPDRWIPESQNLNISSFSVDSSVYRIGAQSARIDSPIPNDCRFVRYNIPVRPYSKYRLSGYIKTSGVTGKGATLYVESGSLGMSQAVTGTTADWQKVELVFITNTMTTAKIYCRLGYPGELSTGTAWFDDLSLEDLYNFQFEDGIGVTPLSWTTYSQTPLPGTFVTELNTPKVFSGNRSAGILHGSVTHPLNDSAYVNTNAVLSPNANYRLRAWVKTENVEGGKGANIAVHFGDTWVVSEGILGTNDWQEVIITFRSSVMTPLEIQCRLGQTPELGGPSRGLALFDNLSLEPYWPGL